MGRTVMISGSSICPDVVAIIREVFKSRTVAAVVIRVCHRAMVRGVFILFR